MIINPGDFILLKPNITENIFGLTDKMMPLMGKIIQVKRLDINGKDAGFVQERDPSIDAYPGTFTWDFNCAERIVTKEDDPEYFL